MWQNTRNPVLRKLHLWDSKVSGGHKEWTEANLRLHLSCCATKWGKMICGVRTGVHDWMCLHSILLLSVHQEQISVVGSLSHFPNSGVILWSGLNFSEKFVIYPFVRWNYSENCFPFSTTGRSFRSSEVSESQTVGAGMDLWGWSNPSPAKTGSLQQSTWESIQMSLE